MSEGRLAQACVCGAVYEVPSGVAVSDIACPRCLRPCGSPGGAFVIARTRSDLEQVWADNEPAANEQGYP